MTDFDEILHAAALKITLGNSKITARSQRPKVKRSKGQNLHAVSLKITLDNGKITARSQRPKVARSKGQIF